MPRSNPVPLQIARAELGHVAQDHIHAVATLAAASAERSKLARQAGTDRAAIEAAEKNYREAVAALETVRVRRREVGATLHTRLAELPEPAEAIAALDHGYPTVLFPVRLETRFIRFDEPIRRPPFGSGNRPPPQVGELRVRIYPDAILADSHEPLLSPVETQAGRDYWTTAWAKADEQDSWTALVAAIGAPRAAWIVRQCQPTNVAEFPRSIAAIATAPAPVFPTPGMRTASWHRAPVAHLLPDRWVIHAQPYRAMTQEEQLLYRVPIGPVIEPLTLTMGFTADGVTDERVELTDGLKIDPDTLWTVDFQEAERVGMAGRIPLAEDDFARGLHRVIVLGVKASLTPQQAVPQLRDLFDHHRFSRGWAFVPQGTPTNNTTDAVSGYPPPDPRATTSFRVERGRPVARSSDGARFMTALGLPPEAADHVAGPDRDEQGLARAMAIALWPATLGYYMKQMLASELDVPDQPADLSDEMIEALRRHFVDLVRGRGPFPAFRIGDVPYGLLPVSLLEQNATGSLSAPSGLDAYMLSIVSYMQQNLGSLAAQYAPRVGRTGDPDADLMDTFRMDASAREVYVRPVLGEATVDNAAGFAGLDDFEKIHTPISLNKKIDLGGPEPTEMTLKTLLVFPESEPDVVVERPPRGPGIPDG